MKKLFLLLIPALSGCFFSSSDSDLIHKTGEKGVELVVLGIAQDAGYPQADCKKACCEKAWQDPDLRKMVSCLGLYDFQTDQYWLLDATPDFKDQLFQLQQVKPYGEGTLAGILLTHAHMGHYTGLMHLGREAMGANKVPVYAMPRMSSYLTRNGPWSQLINLENIIINPIVKNKTFYLNQRIQITPLQVPHRDEFSETVGFFLKGPLKSALFIPDIDKWHLWEEDIKSWIKKVDFAFLDGTFYQNGEIPGRDMSEIPHPFIEESLTLFEDLSPKEKRKIHFIHFNHTNPVLDSSSNAYQEVIKKGLNIAREMDRFVL